MLRTAMKLTLIVILIYSALGVSLLLTEAIHGINDQDASYALALLVYFVNMPSVWLFKWTGVSANVLSVVVVGLFQWSLSAFLVGTVYAKVRSKLRENTAEQ